MQKLAMNNIIAFYVNVNDSFTWSFIVATPQLKHQFSFFDKFKFKLNI